jgi:hypothetical protein
MIFARHQHNDFSIFSTRIIPKRINVRVEHVRPSNSRADFLTRCKANDKQKRDFKEGKAEWRPLKRQVGFLSRFIRSNNL